MSLFGNKNESTFGAPSQSMFASRAATPFTPRGATKDVIKAVPANATKTNVLSSTNGGNSIMPIIDNRYGTYKRIVNIVGLYEYYSLTEKIQELIRDYIIRTIDYEAKIIASKDKSKVDQKAIDRVNDIFDSLDFRKLVTGELDKINYYGSTAYAIACEKSDEPETRGLNKYSLSKLKSPHDVIAITYDKMRFYLVNKGPSASEGATGIKPVTNAIGSMTTKINTELLTDDKILYLGSLDFELKHDEDSKKELEHHFKGTKDDFINDNSQVNQYNVQAYKNMIIDEKLTKDNTKASTELNDPDNSPNQTKAFDLSNSIQKNIYKGIISHKYNLMASKPLYYSVHQMMKDFFIKDMILYVLGVKSSVQPQVLTWGVDSSYNYTVDELMDMIASIEGRMNKLVDIDMINSANMDMDILVNRILGNIRVLPDLGNNIRSLDEKEIDNITKRIEDLTLRRQQVKDEILDSIGIPKDLFEGATNREEVIKRDERFQSMVLKYITRLKSAIKYAAITFAKLEGFEGINPDDLEVPMFKKSSIEYNLNTAKLDSIRDFTNTIVTVMADVQQLIQTNMIDKLKLRDFIHKQLSIVGDEVAELIVEKLPDEPESGRYSEEFIDGEGKPEPDLREYLKKKRVLIQDQLKNKTMFKSPDDKSDETEDESNKDK